MPLPVARPVKPRANVSDDEDDYDAFSDDSSPSVIETGEGDEDQILTSSGSDQEENVKDQLSNISFGTLSKAQESISRKRKRGSEDAAGAEDKLEALRARLRELREAKGADKPAKKSDKKSDKSAAKPAAKKSRKSNDESDQESGSDDDSESDESDDGGPRKSRSSKHAPMSQSSTHQVTRKRQVIDVPKKHIRDPRFGPLGGPVDDTQIAKKYSFLNDYQDSEMNELKAAIKKTKNEDDKEVLKRKLLSMESKKKARENKERQQDVIREHRKKEKEAIKQGKNPFYLKKSDQKQMALVEKFNSMKSKDREKLIQRRQKKVAGKEKKNMPAPRRM